MVALSSLLTRPWEKIQADFHDIFENVLKPHDGKLIYSGISPRVFEAAALKTPLIMFPGWLMVY